MWNICSFVTLRQVWTRLTLDGQPFLKGTSLTNTFGIFWDAFASSIAIGYGGGYTAKRHTLQYAVRETAKLKVDNFSFSTNLNSSNLADGFFEIYLYLRLPFTHEVVEGSAYRPNLLLKRSRPLPGRGDLPRIAEAWPVSANVLADTTPKTRSWAILVVYD